LVYELKDKAHTVLFADSITLPNVPYYGTATKKLEIKLPHNLITGKYELAGKIVRHGKIISHNFYKLFIADNNHLAIDSSKISLEQSQ
jgi:hypothetical protein